jgi:hypothetical protein
LLIGNGSGYSLATLTAGANITVTNSAGGITIASSGGSASAGGSAGQVQYNSGGALGGAANLLISSNGVANVGAAISDPGTYVAGDLWPSSTSGGLKYARAAGLGGPVPVTIFSCGSCTALSNFTAITSALGSPANVQGSLTIPANTLKVGNMIEILVFGKWGAAATAPAYTHDVRFGTTTVLQTIGTPTALPVNQAGQFVSSSIPIRIYVNAVGAAGAVSGAGTLTYYFSTGALGGHTLQSSGTGSATAVPVDTTAPIAIDFRTACSAASGSNTFQLTGMLVNIYN